MTGTMADTLSMLGLVAGFPLLLLCFMLSLEKLESWGLREDAPRPNDPLRDRVDAAVEEVEQLAAAHQPPAGAPTVESEPVSAATHGARGSDSASE